MLSQWIHRDARAVRRVMAGRPEAFEPLVRRYLPAVHAVAWAHTRNHADADELTQQVFLSAYEALPSLREPSQFKPWLLSITRNRSRDVLRMRRREAEALAEAAKLAETPAADPGHDEVLQILHSQLDAMDGDARELILLHYFSGYNAREIGEMLNLSHSAVRKRLQRARETLGANMLKALGEEPQRVKHDRTVKTIMGTIGATTLNWKASAAAAAMVSGKAIGGAVTAISVCAVLVAALILFWPQAKEETTEAEPVVALEETPPAPLEVPEYEVEEAPVPAAPSSPEPVPAVAAVQPEFEVPEGMAGLWEVYVTPTVSLDADVGGAAEMLVEILDDNGTIRAFSRSEDASIGVLRGTYLDGQITLASYPPQTWTPITNAEPDPSLVESYLKELGDASPNRQERAAENLGRLMDSNVSVRATVKSAVERLRFDESADVREGANMAIALTNFFHRPGFLTFSGSINESRTRFAGDAVMTDEKGDPSGEQRIPLLFVRLNPEDMEQLATNKAIEAEIAAFRKALNEYVTMHNELPETLDALLASAPELEAGWTHLSRRGIVLNRGGMVTRPDPSQLQLDDTFRPDLAPADRMIAWEENLQEAWGPLWPSGQLVATARIPEADQIVRVWMGPTGGLETTFGELETSGESPHEAQADAQQSACMNNMKQMGIIIKMFQNEDRYQMVPPGWRTAYPEYMTDTDILQCPCASHGDVDYQILFPAFSQENLMAVAESVIGISDGTAENALPIVVETETNHRQGARRNVLFLDGHVESMSVEEYAARVEPFLPYSVAMP